MVSGRGAQLQGRTGRLFAVGAPPHPKSLTARSLPVKLPAALPSFSVFLLRLHHQATQ